LVTFDENCAKQAAWSSSTHLDVKKTARRVVEQLIQSLLDAERQDLLDSTNWVSMVAGVAKHIADWNESLARRTGASIASRVQ
jgi:predicted NodU family carbamoyl transferase